MARKETTGRITKPAAKKTKNRSRKGRPMAIPLSDLPADALIRANNTQTMSQASEDVNELSTLPSLQPRVVENFKQPEVILEISKFTIPTEPIATAQDPSLEQPQPAKKSRVTTKSKASAEHASLTNPQPAKESTLKSKAAGRATSMKPSTTVQRKRSKQPTPVEISCKNNAISSNLSAASATIGSAPEGFSILPQPKTKDNLRSGSLVRRSARVLKRTAKAADIEDASNPSKRRKVTKTKGVDILPSIEESPHQTEPLVQQHADETSVTKSKNEASTDRRKCKSVAPNKTETQPVKTASTTSRKRKTVTFAESEMPPANIAPVKNYKRKAAVLDDNQADEVIPVATRRSQRNKKPKLSHNTSTEQQAKKLADKAGSSVNKPLPVKKTKAEIATAARELAFYQRLSKEVVQYSNFPYKDEHSWPQFNKEKIIMYGSDAQTVYTPAFAEAPRRGGKTNGKGGARGGRGGVNGRGRGGKNRGRGRDDDSPEPPVPRRTEPKEDTLLIKHVKARQTELRKFFNIVGNHQTEILDDMSSRDLNRLAKKPKAHKSVPENEELLEELKEWKNDAQDLARKQYEFEVEAERRRYEAEKEAIESRCKTKIADLQDEYKKGAQGDLIIFRRAIAAAHDETRTQDGSEADYFPQYHEMSEPNENIRGYASTRIMDEKAFKPHLQSYDDQARRDVIDDDMGPIIQAFAQKNAEHRAAEQRRKTQTMKALSEEASKRLKETKESLKEVEGYLIARPMWREEDVNSYALSTLADVADFMAQQYPNKQYIYMPLRKGQTLPRDSLNYDPLPGQGVKVPQPPLPAPPPLKPVPAMQTPAVHESSMRSTLNHQQSSAAIPPAQGSRRSLRNLQPITTLVQTQMQQATPAAPTPAYNKPAVTVGSGPALAPAPPKLAPAPSNLAPQPQLPSINTRPHGQTPPEQSPGQGQSTQHNHPLPPLQPRHMSQSSLPPPPPGYAYPQQFSPTHPPQSYPPPPPQHGMPSPYQNGSAPSPYSHQNPSIPPLPYGQSPPYRAYSATPYFRQPPPQQQQQQQYSFMPPQGPASSQQSSNPARPQSSFPASSHKPEPYPNHYQHHSPTPPFPFTNTNPNGIPPPLPPVQTTTSAKGRNGRTKAKQPVTFVNQTLATRKAAAEQLAREEAAAAAERKEKKQAVGGGTIGNNRKLAARQ